MRLIAPGVALKMKAANLHPALRRCQLKLSMMRDTDQFMIRQKPHSNRAVYSVTMTLSAIFQVREKPRLIHNSGKPRMAVTKKSRHRINQGRSRTESPRVAEFAA